MSLLKKTIVLSGQPPKGYLTALKIGTTAGLKLSLSEVRPETVLAVKIGKDTLLTFPVRALKEEFRMDADFEDKTPISAAVFLNGELYAYSGASPAIAFSELRPSAPFHKKEEPLPTSDNTIQSTVSETETAKPENATVSASKNIKSDTENVFFDTQSSADPEASAKKEDKPQSEQTEDAATKRAEHASAEVVEDASFRFFKKQTDAHFYDRVRGRMDELLTVHPREETLERLIPDSRWVKVPYADDEFYVVGTLSDGAQITHIGYGVKGIRSVLPPKEAEALSEFLPTNGDEGYWLMFQDAETGEMLPTE